MKIDHFKAVSLAVFEGQPFVLRDDGALFTLVQHMKDPTNDLEKEIEWYYEWEEMPPVPGTERFIDQQIDKFPDVDPVI